QERISIAVSSLASCRRSLADTIAYVRERHAFGQPIAAFQNTQFKLAELATQVEIGEAFVDRVLAAHGRGEELVQEASMAKWWTTGVMAVTIGASEWSGAPLIWNARASSARRTARDTCSAVRWTQRGGSVWRSRLACMAIPVVGT